MHSAHFKITLSRKTLSTQSSSYLMTASDNGVTMKSALDVT